MLAHAYCLMTNHFHLELTTGEVPIWKIIHPVMNNYARLFNRKNGFDGHLFDSRYTSCMIEDEVYFLEVSRYTHLNPVKAAMVREPLSYEHSGYGLYLSDGKYAGGLVDTSRVLSTFRHNPREQYFRTCLFYFHLTPSSVKSPRLSNRFIRKAKIIEKMSYKCI